MQGKISREILNQYDALIDESSDLSKRIEELSRKISRLTHDVVSDTVKGTREDGTYGPIKIKGMPTVEIDETKEQLNKKLRKYKETEVKIGRLRQEIEEYIFTVDDSRIRTILRLRYVDGKTWLQIGMRYGKSKQWAYSKIERYFEKNT